MAKTIKGSEIIEDGHLSNAIKQAETLKKVYTELDVEIKKLAKSSKSGLGGVNPNSAQGIAKINAEVKESIKLKNASIEADKKVAKSTKLLTSLTDAQVREKERLKRANKAQRDAIKAEIVLTDKLAGEEEKLLALNTKLRLERKKLTKADKNYESELKRINTALDKNNAKIIANSDNLKKQRMNVGNYGSAVNKITNVVKGFGVALLASFSIQAVKGFFVDSINGFRQQEKAVAKVNQAINSTGGVAGKTTKELEKMAQALQSNSLFGDEQILNDVSAQLLTFTNISGNQFDRTQQVALDLATVLDGDLKSASIQLGKALNDPVANLSALSRSGIQFSTDQKETIKSLAETNQLAEAQNVILTELERQYGGQALAAAEADGGFTQLKNTFGDLQEIIGGALLDAIKPIVKDLKEFLENLSEEDIEKFTKALTILVDVIAWIGEGIASNIGGILDLVVAWDSAFDSVENFQKALAETIDAFTAFVTGGLVTDYTKDLLGLGDATEEYNAEQREAIRITALAQTGIKKLGESVVEYTAKEQAKINMLVKGNLSEEKRAKLIGDLNEKYPELLENYDLENLSQEDAIQLNKELQKEIINTAILKQKQLALTFLNTKVEEEFNKAQKITNADVRAQRIKDIEDTKKVQLARINAIEEETRIRLGLKEVIEDTKIIEGGTDGTGTGGTGGGNAPTVELDVIPVVEGLPIEDYDWQKHTNQIAEQIIDDVDDIGEEIETTVGKDSLNIFTRFYHEWQLMSEDNKEKLISDVKELAEQTTELFKGVAEAINMELDASIESSQNRIADSEERISDLKAQAQIGNLDAQESVKAEKQAIANERENIEALEKKKRNLQILVTGLNLANQKIQSGDGNALASASGQMGNFISTLKGFYKGTETTLGADLGNAYAISGDKDTHIIKAHKDEHIIGVENSRKLGGMKQSDIVKGALMLKNGEFVGRRAINAVNKVDMLNDSRIVNAMSEVKQAIKNIKIPEHKFNYDALSKIATETIRIGNKTTNNNKKMF